MLFVRARNYIRFGLINQIPNHDVTHFKAEMLCPGFYEPVKVSKKSPSWNSGLEIKNHFLLKNYLKKI